MQLYGKSAIVTGGGRGIGRSIALAFARAGADVCVIARTQSQIDEVAEEIRKLGRTGAAIVCDVTDFASVESAVNDAANALGRIDILVNNAGGGEERTKVGDDDPAAWRHAIEVNLLGTYYFSRETLPHLRKGGGGTIINVGSGMGHQARVGNSSYNAAKAGVWMLTRCMAMELSEQDVTVNELIPGPVATELTSGLFEEDKPHPSIPGEWVKAPDDVVSLALYLAGQGPKGPTGQSFSLARRPL
ncbi:MAG: short-chain dehydrogenase [Planctomycetaceae bacterium]|nr:short-chain dehydrogenase [Planctomycetaceae bacterium]